MLWNTLMSHMFLPIQGVLWSCLPDWRPARMPCSYESLDENLVYTVVPLSQGIGFFNSKLKSLFFFFFLVSGIHNISIFSKLFINVTFVIKMQHISLAHICTSHANPSVLVWFQSQQTKMVCFFFDKLSLWTNFWYLKSRYPLMHAFFFWSDIHASWTTITIRNRYTVFAANIAPKMTIHIN